MTSSFQPFPVERSVCCGVPCFHWVFRGSYKVVLLCIIRESKIKERFVRFQVPFTALCRSVSYAVGFILLQSSIGPEEFS